MAVACGDDDGGQCHSRDEESSGHNDVVAGDSVRTMVGWWITVIFGG